MSIFINRFHESEIRPKVLFEQWKEILEKDISTYFADKNKFMEVSCPGCGRKKSNPAFMKLGFEYRRCNACSTLFVSPRPQAVALQDFYRNCRAIKFWRDKVIVASGKSRQTHQMLPRYMWVMDLVRDYVPQAGTALDYKPKYSSLFLFDKDFAGKFSKLVFIEPLALKQSFSTRGIKVVDDLGTFKGKVDVFCAFDVLDREHDPARFVKEAARACRKGGLLILTTNTISGFEYQILGRNSPRLVPPDRLNLFSVEAIQKLLAREGFRITELSTPGKLDVELVANALRDNPNIEMPEFLRYMFSHRDQDTWESFQDFLQMSKLSSYLRVAAIKK